MKAKKINIITLGCSKNLVDSEYLMKHLDSNGYKIIIDSNKEADIVIINTCGFINDAKQESIDMILQFEKLRKQKKIEKLFVFGCLSERYKEELEKELPFVDKYFGVYNIKELVESIGGCYKDELIGERILTTPNHYAYLKISEGCDRKCSFCAIPLIKGKHKSRPIDDIVSEAIYLVNKGVKEVILIAQDLSYYGFDLYKEFKLAELIDKISDIEGLEWLRLHYTFPAKFPENVIPVMKSKANICKYIDIPFQHISDKLLKIMRRGIDKKKSYDLINNFRNQIPGIAIRTTLLVGHPGETDEDFNELIEFVKKVKFERLGIFTYSEEENTYSAKKYKDEIPFEVKLKRMEAIQDIQRDISNELNHKKIGKIFEVIIDRVEGDYFIGRTEFDSPEVDNEVIIKDAEKLNIGDFYNIEIYDADDYDLYGKVIQ